MKIKAKAQKGLTEKTIVATLMSHNDLLKKYKVKKIGLFGSFARGDQKRKSDIDFLVVFDEATFDNFMNLAFSLEKFFKRKVDLITEKSLSPYVRPYVEKNVRWYEV